jgi:hypothetical protein
MVDRHARARARALKLGLAPRHARRLAALDTPERIQDFVTRLPTNFEPDGDTCLSVAEALRQNRAHCIEAAFVAACALGIHGRPPLLMDFQADNDDDHVVALLQRGGCWGAISKSNHNWLRWRDPVYRSLRELAMSWFHEYCRGPRKTVRRYSRAIDLRRADPAGRWLTATDDCFDVAETIDLARHHELVTAAQSRRLRRRDPIERRAGLLVDTKPPNRKVMLRY